MRKEEIEKALKHIKDRTKYAMVSTDINLDVIKISVKALEKQLPSKVKEGTEGGFDWYCKCGTYLSPIKCEEMEYCISCGQKLNWD